MKDKNTATKTNTPLNRVRQEKDGNNSDLSKKKPGHRVGVHMDWAKHHMTVHH